MWNFFKSEDSEKEVSEEIKDDLCPFKVGTSIYYVDITDDNPSIKHGRITGWSGIDEPHNIVSITTIKFDFEEEKTFRYLRYNNYSQVLQYGSFIEQIDSDIYIATTKNTLVEVIKTNELCWVEHKFEKIKSFKENSDRYKNFQKLKENPTFENFLNYYIAKEEENIEDYISHNIFQINNKDLNRYNKFKTLIENEERNI